MSEICQDGKYRIRHADSAGYLMNGYATISRYGKYTRNTGQEGIFPYQRSLW
jgi:hypothetical protein